MKQADRAENWTKLVFRQGTLYRLPEKELFVVLINHNPLKEESLLFRLSREAVAGGWPLNTERIPVLGGRSYYVDLNSAGVVTLDQLIEVRKVGLWQDCGDLPSTETAGMLGLLLRNPALPEEWRPLLEELA